MPEGWEVFCLGVSQQSSISSFTTRGITMQKKEKTLVICKCGRQLEGKFWVAPDMNLRQWIKILARRLSKTNFNLKVEKWLFCQGKLKDEPRPVMHGWEQ